MKVSNPIQFLLSVLVVGGVIEFSHGEVLKSKDGREIEVNIIEVTSEEVSFSRVGATQVYRLALSELSEDSVSMLEKWEPPVSPAKPAESAKVTLPKIEITYSAGKSNQISKKERFDDRSEVIQPTVKIQNADLNKALEGVRMTVVTFARGIVDRRSIKVMTKNSFDLKIPPLEEASYKCSRASNEYDRQGGARYGYKYLGYVLVITDSKGNILLTKGTPPAYEKMPERILKVTPGKLYDTKLNSASTEGL